MMPNKNSPSPDSNSAERIDRMIKVVDSFVMMTDDREDLLALACAMIAKSRDIFDSHIGVDGRVQMFVPMLNTLNRS